MSKLVRECKTEAGFRKLLGTEPRDEDTGAWGGPPPPNATPPWKATTGGASTTPTVDPQ